jgi:integrase
VLPVPDATVAVTLPHLPPVVADMVRVQRLTGMRPGEVCRMVATELDMSGEVWVYKPRDHKTAHHGKVRAICIGPKAQAILGAYLRTDRLNHPLFSPEDADHQRRERLRAENQTAFTPSRLRRDAKRAANPKRKFNGRYDVSHYARAIHRACEDAGVPCWAPNQLRHAKATELRHGGFGLEGAGAVLGHSKLETTQIYAERDEGVARRIALATG